MRTNTHKWHTHKYWYQIKWNESVDRMFYPNSKLITSWAYRCWLSKFQNHLSTWNDLSKQILDHPFCWCTHFYLFVLQLWLWLHFPFNFALFDIHHVTHSLNISGAGEHSSNPTIFESHVYSWTNSSLLQYAGFFGEQWTRNLSA